MQKLDENWPVLLILIEILLYNVRQADDKPKSASKVYIDRNIIIYQRGHEQKLLYINKHVI